MKKAKSISRKSNGLKRRAEKLLSKKGKSLQKVPTEDVQKLVHELQVHQIELEMQNEELRKAQVEIEHSRSKYSDLYDFAPVGYFTFDRKGMILEANLTGAQLLGVGRPFLVKKPFRIFVDPEFQDVFLFHRGEVFKTGLRKTCELKLNKKDGYPFYASLETIAVKDSDGKFTDCRSAVSDITARKQAEQALRRYEFLADQSRDMILFMRRDDGQILEANAAAVDAYGYPREELLTLSIQDLRAVGTRELTPDQMALADARGILFETVHRRKDGSTFPVEVSSRGATIGSTRALISVVRDITERKQAEEALHESEARYRSLFENMLDGFAYCEMLFDEHSHPVDFVYLEVNHAFERLTGLKNVTGKRVSEVIPGVKESRPELFETYGRVALTGQPERFEINFTPLGVWLSIAVYSPRKKYFVTVFENITRRKRAEEALSESERHYRLLFETMTQGVIYQDADGNIISMNPAAERILGKTPAEFLRDASADVESHAIREDGSPLPGLEHPSMIALRTGKEIRSTVMGVSNPREAGYRWINVSAVPLFRAGESKPYQVYVVFDDVTEREKMEEELRKSRDELEIRVQGRTAELERSNRELQREIAERERTEGQLWQAQKMQAIGTLAGGIAHDFNNMLSVIRINADLALLDLPGESPFRNNLGLIAKAGQRGIDLVRQLLLFGRRSEKKQEIFSLSPLIEETCKMLRAPLPATIDIELHLDTDSDTVLADPSQIQQVIMNLCINAAHAMRGRVGKLEIGLQSITFGSTDLPGADMQPGGYLVLSVKDTGSGMDEEIRRRIFDPFFTTKPVGEGTGLGLAVVYGIVKSHRGGITVYSEPGKGSIFKVYLPRVYTGVSAATETPNPIPRGNERILVIDDEEIVVNSLQSMLQHLGYKVTALMDNRGALKLFSEKPAEFDLVITDQTMPFMTGEDLSKEIMGIRPDIPVILCTGYSDLISSEKAAVMGFRGFIVKPFNVREGAELVRRVLDESKPK